MEDLREIALHRFIDVMENRFLSKKLQEKNAFVEMLILTTLRHLIYVNKNIQKYITKKLEKQNVYVKSALVLAAVEIIYMNAPDYAIINSYVNLVKKKTNKYMAGFVNAVLRKICKNKAEIQQNDRGAFFTSEFIKLLKKDYNEKEIAQMEKVCAKEAMLDITCCDSASEIYKKGEVMPLGTLRIEHKGKIEELPDYDKGVWWVQDFSSALPVKMLDDIENKNVLDVCAAPGGKTAQLIAKGAKVTSIDISKDRLDILQQNLQRLSLKAQKVIAIDAVKFFAENDIKYDVVVLDAPCSATGTLRRHPEIVHFKTIKDVEKMAILQEQLLEMASKALKKEGVLLYCVCSLSKKEGEMQIEKFISKNKNFKIVNLQNKIPQNLADIANEKGCIRVLPHYLQNYGGADGFFVACLKKEQ